jgi:hypothetical protein
MQPQSDYTPLFWALAISAGLLTFSGVVTFVIVALMGLVML